MVQHHHRSDIAVRMVSADESVWGAVANRPPVPDDLENRQNIQDAAMPRRSDKEIYKVLFRAAVIDPDAVGLPVVVLTDNRSDAILPTASLGGEVGDTNTARVFNASAVTWWPSVGGGGPVADTLELDLEQNPTLWEDEDLIHLGVGWATGAIRVQVTLFWRHS